MQYTNALSDDGQHVVFTVTGDFTANEILAAIVEAHHFAEKCRVFRILTDLTRGRNCDSALQNYDFANTNLPTAIRPNNNMRVAILLNPDDPSHDFPRVAMESAGTRAVFFTDRETAVAYLRQSSAPG